MASIFQLNVENHDNLLLSDEEQNELNQTQEDLEDSLQDQAEEQEIQALQNEGNSLNSELQDDIEALVTMEALADKLERDGSKGLGENGVQYLRLSLEMLSEKYQLKEGIFPTLNMESFNSDPEQEVQLVVESLRQGIATIGNKIKAGMANALTNIAGIFGSIKARSQLMTKEIAALEKLLADKKATNTNGPKQLILQPKGWFRDISFHSAAPKKGLVELHPLLQHALSDTLDISNEQTAKYVQWITKNKDKLQNPGVFSSLKYDPKDFTLKGSTVFNDRIENMEAETGFSLYRSKELPGGMALYSHVKNKAVDGVEVNEALWNTFWMLKPYDPIQFDQYDVKLRAFMAISAVTFSLTVAPLAINLYLPAMLAHNAIKTGNPFKDATLKRDENNEVVGKSTVKLTPEFIFQTLSFAEIERVIKEAKEGQKSIDAFIAASNQITKGLYLPELSDTAEAIDKKKSSNRSGTERALVDLAYSVSTLHHNVLKDIPTYVQRTYRMMIRYADKSAKQY